MFGFSRQKVEDTSTLVQRITDVQARVLALEINEEVFRNKVLRKVQRARIPDPQEDLEEEEEEEEEEEQTIEWKQGGIYRGRNT